MLPQNSSESHTASISPGPNADEAFPFGFSEITAIYHVAPKVAAVGWSLNDGPDLTPL
jgi:hypothetical protein